jgi:hypothetical protein
MGGADVTDMRSSSQFVVGVPPSTDAPMQEKLDFLHGQLDSLKGKEILSGLLLQDGASNRLVGGASLLLFLFLGKVHVSG